MCSWLCVCLGVCIYAFVSRSNQPIFLSQSCHHWNPFEVVPKQQVPPCALISYTRIQIPSRSLTPSLTHTHTHTHTQTHTRTPFSSLSKDRASFPKVTPTCCPSASLTRPLFQIPISFSFKLRVSQTYIFLACVIPHNFRSKYIIVSKAKLHLFKQDSC